ncbi:MAG: outer membrane lipoprotein carrier protein LolA [Spirochaetota bacterium]|nr:MAG: outer membrane lipoprotein carrier protein LolA [Spirochaetota bacterium]
MKIGFLYPLLFIILLTTSPLFAQEEIDTDLDINIVSINDIKMSMTDMFNSIDDYTADFNWINGDVSYLGVIKYKKPDKILLEFDEPEEQKIVSNGNVLYIYIPYLKVVAQQSLSESTESMILSTASESGLSKLFDEYSFSFYGTSTLQPFGGTNAYHLKLNQKRPKVGFKQMDFWVSEDGLILQSNGVSPNEVEVSLTFSNIRLNEELPDYIFDFEVPADAQIIRNIIVPFK